jgi:hypothetical protein
MEKNHAKDLFSMSNIMLTFLVARDINSKIVCGEMETQFLIVKDAVP